MFVWGVGGGCRFETVKYNIYEGHDYYIVAGEGRGIEYVGNCQGHSKKLFFGGGRDLYIIDKG